MQRQAEKQDSDRNYTPVQQKVAKAKEKESDQNLFKIDRNSKQSLYTKMKHRNPL